MCLINLKMDTRQNNQISYVAKFHDIYNKRVLKGRNLMLKIYLYDTNSITQHFFTHNFIKKYRIPYND